MSQNDFNIANQGFPATRADINSALQALASNSAGTAEPSTTYAYQFWYDETNELLKMRNSDNDAWITIGTFDQVADTFTPAGVTTDKIEEGNSSVEVVDTGTGYVAIVVDGVETARFDANGRLGIGTTAPNTVLHVSTATTTKSVVETTGASSDALIEFTRGQGTGNTWSVGLDQSNSSALSFAYLSNGSPSLTSHNKMTLDSSGNVGINSSAPTTLGGGAKLTVNQAADGDIVFARGGSTRQVQLGTTSATGYINADNTSGGLAFHMNGTERARIDSSGNSLVGTTVTEPGASNTTTGSSRLASGGIRASSSYDTLSVNRNSTDGTIINIRRNGSEVGRIGAASGEFYLGSITGSDAFLRFGYSTIVPANSSGSNSDNTTDLGSAVSRFDDVYATNGTIQTSDANEKQDIEALSDAEQRVAVAAKGLLRKYRWKDAVAEKGDAARIHFGIIAQDLQAAFEAEGLDAGRYAMFISSTWWEADRVIPAVEAVEAQDAVYETVVVPAVLDEDGNEIEPERTEQVLVSEAVEAVEAQPERTVTDTFDTQEEAPEGAVERTRMGVRYPELLAFIIAAI